MSSRLFAFVVDSLTPATIEASVVKGEDEGNCVVNEDVLTAPPLTSLLLSVVEDIKKSKLSAGR